MSKKINFVFLGGEPLAIPTLEKLKAADLLPTLIVCNPDRPAGRGHKLTPPPVKIWAEINKIPFFQPDNYKNETVQDYFKVAAHDLFVVVAYNFILPNWLLKIPRHGVINVHPSLLPKLRGASPIRSAILLNQPDAIGVTIICLDEIMDHGPIIAQEKFYISAENWPLPGPTLDLQLAEKGGMLLAATIPEWIAGNIIPKTQDHTIATFCHKLQKCNAELQINPFNLPIDIAGKKALHTIYAYSGIGDSYFIHENKRIKIKDAVFQAGRLYIRRVIPEGMKEINFEQYLKSIS